MPSCTNQGEVVLRTLADYLEGQVFTAVCRDCNRQVRLDGQELVNRYGANTEAANVRDRLRCSACGQKPGFMMVGSAHAMAIRGGR